MLINLKTYASVMGITRQGVRYQLSKGICPVAPVEGTKPPKWQLADVEAYREKIAALAGETA
jgi:hypothetical protein